MAANEPGGRSPRPNGASGGSERAVTTEPAAGFEREVTSLPDGRRLTLYRRRPAFGGEPGAEIIER